MLNVDAVCAIAWTAGCGNSSCGEEQAPDTALLCETGESSHFLQRSALWLCCFWIAPGLCTWQCKTKHIDVTPSRTVPETLTMIHPVLLPLFSLQVQWGLVQNRSHQS